MPEGPCGEKRPGDVIGVAIMVAKIAAGEVEHNATSADKAHPSAGGKQGGAARAAKLSPVELGVDVGARAPYAGRLLSRDGMAKDMRRRRSSMRTPFRR
jgi:hypothetical protein